jgi:hypothetical protein
MLLDNYVADTDVEEELTEENAKEEVDFIDAIYDTKVIQETHRYLIEHGLNYLQNNFPMIKLII